MHRVPHALAVSVEASELTMKRKNRPPKEVIVADPDKWSEQSKQSFSYHYLKEYRDKEYKCWHCQDRTLFTAKDQKYTYEVKKAYVWQQRILCKSCWQHSNSISSKINEIETNWSNSKNELKINKEFLSTWLELLLEREKYAPSKPNTAIKNMLSRLISNDA